MDFIKNVFANGRGYVTEELLSAFMKFVSRKSVKRVTLCKTFALGADYLKASALLGDLFSSDADWVNFAAHKSLIPLKKRLLAHSKRQIKFLEHL